MNKVDKLAAALDKFDKIMKLADDKLTMMRDLRYRRILENQQRFAELERQNRALQNGIKPIQTVKIS